MHEKWGGSKMPCSVGLGNCGCVRFQFGATMIHLGVDDFRSFAREALKLLISLSRGQETHPESSHTEVRH